MTTGDPRVVRACSDQRCHTGAPCDVLLPTGGNVLSERKQDRHVDRERSKNGVGRLVVGLFFSPSRVLAVSGAHHEVVAACLLVGRIFTSNLHYDLLVETFRCCLPQLVARGVESVFCPCVCLQEIPLQPTGCRTETCTASYSTGTFLSSKLLSSEFCFQQEYDPNKHSHTGTVQSVLPHPIVCFFLRKSSKKTSCITLAFSRTVAKENTKRTLGLEIRSDEMRSLTKPRVMGVRT